MRQRKRDGVNDPVVRPVNDASPGWPGLDGAPSPERSAATSASWARQVSRQAVEPRIAMSATADKQATPLLSRSVWARKAHRTIGVEKMSPCPKGGSSSRNPSPNKRATQNRDKCFLLCVSSNRPRRRSHGSAICHRPLVRFAACAIFVGPDVTRDMAGGPSEVVTAFDVGRRARFSQAGCPGAGRSAKTAGL